MRRLLPIALLLTVAVAPARASAPATRPAAPALRTHAPGRVAVGPAPTARERLDRVLDQLAGGGPEAKEAARRLDQGQAGANGEITFSFPFAGPDLDGDRYPDVYVYTTTIDTSAIQWDGTTEITAYSGRRNRGLWHRVYDAPLLFPYQLKVGPGAGRLGLVLVGLRVNFATVKLSARYIGVGPRGERYYDHTFDEADGMGDLELGGFFDGVPNGGKDVLIARVERYELPGVKSTNAYGVDFSQPFVLDGRNGQVRPLADRVLGLGGYPVYVATGDIDADHRDDYLLFRQGLQNNGTVDATSSSEAKPIWSAKDVPVGYYLYTSALDGVDYVGNARRDVLYTTLMKDHRLISVPGVTDGLPVIDPGPPGAYGILLDGQDGRLRWSRHDESAFYSAMGDVNRDGKADVLGEVAILESKRAGVRLLAITGANRVLYQREITVPRETSIHSYSAAGAYDAGDLDRDGVRDIGYYAGSGNEVIWRYTNGFMLARGGKTFASDDSPLYGSLDGRGDDRVAYVAPSSPLDLLPGAVSTITLTPRDGATGTKFWSLSATGPAGTFGMGMTGLPGARGRCADLLFVAGGKGWTFMALYDGGTGRMRWRRTLLGSPPELKLRTTGRGVRCG
jgi:hypothetical protein